LAWEVGKNPRAQPPPSTSSQTWFGIQSIYVQGAHALCPHSFGLIQKKAKDQGRTLILGDGCRLAQWVQQLTNQRLAQTCLTTDIVLSQQSRQDFALLPLTAMAPRW